MLRAVALSCAAHACQLQPPPADAECPEFALPRVTLASAGGEQIGVHGGFCIGNEACGSSSCVLSIDEPTQSTVVRPGDEVLFSVANGELVVGEGCKPACPPTLWVQKLGCQTREVEHATLVDGVPWVVDLGSGSYWAWVGSHFVTADGWSGSIHVGFGLTVSPKGERRVLDHVGSDGGCDGGVADAE